MGVLKATMRAILSSAAIAVGFSAAAQPCEPAWQPGLNYSGVRSYVAATAHWDDGSGPAIFLGGPFNIAGSAVDAKGLAKWDGQRWRPLDHGIAWSIDDDTFQSISRFLVFDDGSGPALFACGQFRLCGGQPTPSIVKWDGIALHPLPDTFDPRVVPIPLYDMTVFDDGAGPALYVAGQFRGVGGVISPGVAAWNGSAWLPVGAGMPIPQPLSEPFGARSIDVFDDGAGPALYATAFADGIDDRLVRLRAGQWAVITGYSIIPGEHSVRAVPTGPARGLYLSSRQSSIHSLERYDGVSWVPVPGGVNNAPPEAMQTVPTDPPTLAVVRNVDQPTRGRQVQLWDGQAWSNLGAALPNADWPLGVITPHGPSAPPTLIVSEPGERGRQVAARTAQASTPLIEPGSGSEFAIQSFVGFTDGGGAALYAMRVLSSGQFADVARRTADGWERMPLPLPSDSSFPYERASRLRVLETFHGPRLTAVGSLRFPNPPYGQGPDYAVALWDGQAWAPMGTLPDVVPNDWVAWDAASFDSGGGPETYVAGDFPSLDGASALNIAKRTANGWAPLESGLNAPAYALAVHDNGDGERLYAGGVFSRAGAVNARGLASWDGVAWRAVPGFQGYVAALAVAREEGEEVLYIAGNFLQANGVYLGRLATYRHGVFAGTPLSTFAYPALTTLTVHGEGPTQYVLVAGAGPLHVGSNNLGAVAIFDGVRWTGLGGDVDGAVRTIHVSDNPTGGVTITLGGEFTRVNDLASTYIAQIRLCSLACPADVNSDRAINMADLTSLLDQYGAESPTPGFILPADLNADGVVNFLDLNILLSAFGQAC